MKAKEWKELFKNIDDEADIIPYIWNCEYGNEKPYDIGCGEVLELKKSIVSGYYLNIGIHK